MSAENQLSTPEWEIRKWAQNAESTDIDLLQRTIRVLATRFERTDNLSTRCLNCGHEWPDVVETGVVAKYGVAP